MHAETMLQRMKITAAVGIEGDDFAVDDGVAHAKARRHVFELWIFKGDVAAGTRPQRCLAVFDLRDGADAVPFDFEYPVGA